MSEFCIHSTRCFIDNCFADATLHIKWGKIHRIYEGNHKVDAVAFHDYGNLIVMPGIIDGHVHINEPGRTDWEGFDTATKAAAMGGVTTIIDMPLNSHPVTTNIEAFLGKREATRNKLHVNCGFYGGAIPNNKNDIEALIKAGVFGIKGFLTHSGIEEFPNIERQYLENISPILKKYDLPLLLHCELEDDEVPKVVDSKSYLAYVSSRPQRWEQNAVNLALELQKKHGLKVHIVHLSSSDCIREIRQHEFRYDGLTVETCPHYLFFDAESIPDASPIYKCAPPIRERKNNDMLWNAVLDGTIHLIGSDHSPAPPEIKQLEKGDLNEAWGGISGLQFTLPVLTTIAKKYGAILETIIPKLTENPAKFLGLNHRKGFLREGYDADITVYDDEKMMLVEGDIIQHRHKATPYMGHTFRGVVVNTIVNGFFVVQNTRIIKLNRGNFIRRANKNTKVVELTNKSI